MEAAPTQSAKSKQRTKGLALCVICIFLGGAVECTMSNWISAFTENALRIPKVWGDILGAALFAAALAFTRTAYSKYGKNIFNALTVSMACSLLCYLLVALSPSPAVSLIACVGLGVFSAMLWPGTLILMEENMPAVGVTAYALMASGGDLGASVAPQAVGIVVDNVTLTDWARDLGQSLSLTPDQVGFKAGMLVAAIFPVLGVFLLLYMKKFFRNYKKA
jgi:MFS family permease